MIKMKRLVFEDRRRDRRGQREKKGEGLGECVVVWRTNLMIKPFTVCNITMNRMEDTFVHFWAKIFITKKQNIN